MRTIDSIRRSGLGIAPGRTITDAARIMETAAVGSLAVVDGDELIALAALPLPLRAQALPDRFDPKRDPEKDLLAALARAKAEGKRVIVDVGGEWCSWCHVLDRFFASHADLDALRDARCVWLKVNYSKENDNRAFLSRWPKVAGFPHLFVLGADGKLLHSQDTSALEQGGSYDAAKMRAFLERWAAPASAKS